MILKNKSFGCKEKILREILEKNIIWEKSFIGQPCKTKYCYKSTTQQSVQLLNDGQMSA